MALVPTPKNCDVSVRRAIQKLAQTDKSRYFGTVHAQGAVTAYNGRDILRYALMMGLVTRRDN